MKRRKNGPSKIKTLYCFNEKKEDSNKIKNPALMKKKIQVKQLSYIDEKKKVQVKYDFILI